MNTRTTFEEALMRLPAAGGAWDVVTGERGSLVVELYAPKGSDPQSPHLQDELYVVQRGHGVFLSGDSRTPFGPGDVLFVAAGVPHRFESFSDDFATWVVFYGAIGGELPNAQALQEGGDPPPTSELSRNALLWRTRTAYLALDQFLDGLTLAQGNVLTDPAGWAVKDHVAHLVPWMEGMLGVTEGRPKWEGMGLTRAQYDAGFDSANAILFERHKHRSLNDARWLLQATTQRFLRRIAELPKDWVMQPYSSVSDSPRSEPVIFWLWGNSGGHIHEHLPWMQAIARPDTQPR